MAVQRFYNSGTVVASLALAYHGFLCCRRVAEDVVDPCHLDQHGTHTERIAKVGEPRCDLQVN